LEPWIKSSSTYSIHLPDVAMVSVSLPLGSNCLRQIFIEFLRPTILINPHRRMSLPCNIPRHFSNNFFYLVADRKSP
jgi:hypothetical protein